MAEIPSGHITVTDAVQLSSYSRGYIYILLRDKKIKSIPYKFGRMRVFLLDKNSLLEFMEKQGRVPVEAKVVDANAI